MLTLCSGHLDYFLHRLRRRSRPVDLALTGPATEVTARVSCRGPWLHFASLTHSLPERDLERLGLVTHLWLTSHSHKLVFINLGTGPEPEALRSLC